MQSLIEILNLYKNLLNIAVTEFKAIAENKSDEFHQSFVPDRDASLYDLFADAFGAFLGSYFASLIKLRKI